VADRLILVGKVAGAFGVKGELRLTAYTGDPMALLDYGPLRRADGEVALTIETGRAVKGAVIVRAREVATREAAQALRGLGLHVPRSALPALAEDEFYITDLIGLTAVSAAGEPLGTVKSAADFGAGDLLEIAPAGGGPSWWAPFTLAVVPQVRLEEGLIVVARPTEDDDSPGHGARTRGSTSPKGGG
jgi:16S rRNA processing protein RimM